MNFSRAAAPFWGPTIQIPSTRTVFFSPKRYCCPKRGKIRTGSFFSLPRPMSDHTIVKNRFIRRCRPCATKSASQAVLGRMQLTHPWFGSPNTSMSFALGACNQCLPLVGEKRFSVGCSSLTFGSTRLPPQWASRLVHAINVCLWSVKPQRVPSRHWRDARVYGHTTTAMRRVPR